MEFTLRFSGHIPHHSKAEAHKVRCVFHDQLVDYWQRDSRLARINQRLIKPFLRSARFPRGDVRRADRGHKIRSENQIYRYRQVHQIRFVPLATRWRYLRCELSMRIHRYEGDMDRGGILDNNGDLDNKCKTIVDALRVPSPECLDPSTRHSSRLFFCVLEDDRLVDRITMETRNILGPRPPKGNETEIDADIDVRIYPIHRDLSSILNNVVDHS